MLEEQYDLPDEWTWAKIGDVIADAQSGFSSGQKDVVDGIRHLRMNNIGADCRINLDLVRTVPRDLAQPRHILQASDVLVCHTNSVKLVGKTALFDLVDGPYAFSNHLTRLRVIPGVADPKWLWQVLATLWRERYFETRCKQWVNQATIERQTIFDAPIPLPPFDEQRRIVAEIERLFAESRTAREALDGVPALIKRFRQSVLAKAFRGELTERDPSDEPASVLLEQIRSERKQEWRDDLHAKGKEAQKDRYVEPQRPDITDLPELPKGWYWASLEELTSAARVICYGILMPKQHISDGVPYVKVKDIKGDRIDVPALNRTSPEIAAKYARSSLKEGDLLLAIRGTYGRVAEVPEGLDGANITQDTARLVLSPSIDRRYIAIHLRSTFSQNYFKDVARGVAVKGVNIADVRLCPIAVAPLAEQRRIVAKIEALFAQADAIEEAVHIARQRAEKVDQAILARAFSGKLVPQNPDDEPVAVLLARIEQERERAASEAKETKKTPRAKGKKTMQEKTAGIRTPDALTDLLKRLRGKSGKRITPETLWLESGLNIDDFYYYLKHEIKAGHLQERRRAQDVVYLEVIS